MLPSAWTRASHTHRGLVLSYLDTAPDDRGKKPVIMLLHGFPDSAAMWSGVMSYLIDAGYRCVAPDTLGCGESDMANTIDDYRMASVVSDYIALLDHLSIKSVSLMGHDWGSALAWCLAIHHPTRVSRLIGVSVGHPTAFARAGFKQKLMSWYTVFFKLPIIPEAILLNDGPTGLAKLLPLHPGMSEVMQRMQKPGRFKAALNIYRANLMSLLLKKYPPAQCPVLGVWSHGDTYLGERQMAASQHYVDGPFRLEKLEGGHWIPLDQPETLARLALQFFA